MVEPINFLVVNANDWYNKGDVTNRLGLILSLRRAFSGYPIRIFIESLTPKEDQNYFGQFPEVTVFGSMFSSGENKSVSKLIARSIVGLLAFLILFSFYSVAYVLKRDALKKSAYTMKHVTDDSLFNQVRTFTVLLFSSDVVISSPGGFLHDDYPMILLVNLFPLLLALMLKKPLVIYNQSIGPFKSRILFNLTELIVCKARILTLRESYSLGRFNLGCSYLVLSDSTFSIRSYILSRLNRNDLFDELDEYVIKEMNVLDTLKNQNTTIFGLTLVGYYLKYRDTKKMVNYIDFLGNALRKINYEMNRHGKKAHFIIIPQNANSYELNLIRNIARILKKKYLITNLSFIDVDLPPEGIFQLLRKIDVLIASRMHSAIFASMLSVPFVALAYQPKFKGIMKFFNLDDFVIDIFQLNDKNVEMLWNLVERVIRDKKKIMNILQSTTECLEKKSLLTSKMLKKYLSKRTPLLINLKIIM
ncbi:MAG: polysaccharide pyruvyl transferase family protein [Candidatus Asgardarchaeia archaeon]